MDVEMPFNAVQSKPRETYRILMLLTNAFDPDPRVHKEAKSLVHNGYDVTIICWDRDLKAPAREVIDGIKVERIYVQSTHARGTSQAAYLLLFWIKAFILALRKKPDAIHCHDFDTLPPGYLLSRVKSAKLVYDAHESYVDMLNGIPHWLKRAISTLENFLLPGSNLVITVGEILREHLENRGARRSCVVGNWKDPEDFVFPIELINAEKDRLGISKEQMIVCFIANLGYERQLPELIEAVKRNPDVFLILGGNGPAKSLAQEASVKHPNISYLGYVHPSKVPFYTALSDVIFYGFDKKNPNARFSAPNKLFEALAAGKAIIAGDFGELSKIVKETGCGVLLSSYSPERISAALGQMDSGKLEWIKERSDQAARNIYNWKEAHRQLIREYEYLL
jgi:glycosyltransferase involved in cell wall biosynthesis